MSGEKPSRWDTNGLFWAEMQTDNVEDHRDELFIFNRKNEIIGFTKEYKEQLFHERRWEHAPRGGRHLAVIQNTALLGTPPQPAPAYMEVTFRIVQGSFAGYEHTSLFPLRKGSGHYPDAALTDLADIGDACGVPPGDDLRQWHGRHLILFFAHREHDDPPVVRRYVAVEAS